MADDKPYQKLTIQLEKLDEHSKEVKNTLIPPLEASAEIPVAEIPAEKSPETGASVTDTAKSEGSTETHCKTLSEQELRMQREEEKYALFISILSEEEESNTEIDTDDMLIHISIGENKHISEEQ